MQRELNVQETVTNVGRGQRLAGEKGVNSRVYGYVWSIVNQEERVFVSVESRNVCESGLHCQARDLVQSILCISSVLDIHTPHTATHTTITRPNHLAFAAANSLTAAAVSGNPFSSAT